MARAHFVKRSNKEHVCGSGGHVIPKGDPYYWAKPGYRTRIPKIRCKAHPFKESELTTSMASAPLAARESFEEALDAIDATSAEALDDLESALEDLRSAVREYADERRSALDSWENGNSTLEELAETAEGAADEAESYQVDEWTGDVDARDRELGNEPDEDDTANWNAYQAEADEIGEAQESWTEHVSEQIDAARDMAQSLEF